MSSDSLTSLIDALSSYTATGFSLGDLVPVSPSPSTLLLPSLHLSFYINDRLVSSTTSTEDEWKFPSSLGDVSFVANLQWQQGTRVLSLRGETESPESEWSLLAQIRVWAGTKKSQAALVDKDIFGFGKLNKRLLFNLHDDITEVKFELRSIDEFFRHHPSFSLHGDVSLSFPDGNLRTWRALLAWASPYMADNMKEVEEGGVVDLSPFERESFRELLLHLHPTERTLWTEFKSLSSAAVSFSVPSVVARLSEHMANYRKMPIHRRLADAASLHLYPAVATIAEEAARSGMWHNMIHCGFDPVRAVGEGVYNHVVCPSIIRSHFPPSVLPPPLLPFDMASSLLPSIIDPSSASNPWTATISFLGTPFFINSGVLAIHGGGRFSVDNEGRMQLSLSSEVSTICQCLSVSPGEVLMYLLASLYPSGPSVPSRLLRPAIAMAEERGFSSATHRLEQALISEPISSASQIVDHLKLVERYGLKNLHRTTCLRAEGSCLHLMKDVIGHAEFGRISHSVRQPVVSRMCSGWALDCPSLGHRSPSEVVERRVAVAVKVDTDCATFRSIYSDQVFENNEIAT